MRKVVGILVCLLVVLQSFAVTYYPYTPSSGFRSTSAYISNYQSPMTNNQSPMAGRSAGSLSAISAANYEALNSEGGACYNGASGPRRGRPKENDYGGTGAIGNLDYHSPVGEIPWVGMLVLAGLYAIFAKKSKKMQKNLVNS